MPKRWHIRPHDHSAVAALERSSGVSSIVAGLLVARGVTREEPLARVAIAHASLKATPAPQRPPNG